jgi:RNA-directed DNA polymerase
LAPTVNKEGWIDRLSQKATLAYARTKYVDRVMAQQCSSCGSTDGPFEVHHRNPMRNSRGLKAAIGCQRRTVVLCIECHRLLHAGRLPDRRGRVDGNGEPDEAKVSSPVRREGEGCSP